MRTPIPKPKRTMANTSIQKCTPGTNKNRLSARTFINPKIRAGTFRQPPNNFVRNNTRKYGTYDTTDWTNGNNEAGIQRGISFFALLDKKTPQLLIA